MDCEVVMCHDNMQDLDNVPAPSNKNGKKTGKGKKVAKAAMMYKWSSKALQDFLMNCWRDVSLCFRMFWDGKMQFKIPSQITVESLRLGLRSLTSTSQTELWSHLFAQKIFVFTAWISHPKQTPVTSQLYRTSARYKITALLAIYLSMMDSKASIDGFFESLACSCQHSCFFFSVVVS